jgi:hypothetical protein
MPRITVRTQYHTRHKCKILVVGKGAASSQTIPVGGLFLALHFLLQPPPECVLETRTVC